MITCRSLETQAAPAAGGEELIDRIPHSRYLKTSTSRRREGNWVETATRSPPGYLDTACTAASAAGTARLDPDGQMSRSPDQEEKTCAACIS